MPLRDHMLRTGMLGYVYMCVCMFPCWCAGVCAHMCRKAWCWCWELSSTALPSCSLRQDLSVKPRACQYSDSGLALDVPLLCVRGLELQGDNTPACPLCAYWGSELEWSCWGNKCFHHWTTSLVPCVSIPYSNLVKVVPEPTALWYRLWIP